MTLYSNRATLRQAPSKTQNTRAGHASKAPQRGFSMVEMAVTLVVGGLVVGGLMAGIISQLENKKISDTQTGIRKASEAIMAFALVNRRLPCPANATSNGLEVWVTDPDAQKHGRCAHPNNGFIPARTLGLEGQGKDGLVQDAWSFNLRYGVAQVTCTHSGNSDHSRCKVNNDGPDKDSDTSPGVRYPLTQVDGLKNFTDHKFNNFGYGHLEICVSSTGITATACGTGNAAHVNSLTLAKAAFVVWSTGRNGTNEITGADEKSNLDGDPVYVFHPRSEEGAAAGAFDDILYWQTSAGLLSSMSKGWFWQSSSQGNRN